MDLPLISDLPVMLCGGTSLQTGESVTASLWRGRPSFLRGSRNYEMWLWSNNHIGICSFICSLKYFELIFIDLHCHHSGPSHLCPSCRPKQLLPAHFSYRGQRWEGLAGQRVPEMPWWWWWREGEKWCHNRCGKDRSFSPACQQWLG